MNVQTVTMSANNSESGKRYPSQLRFDNVIERLEKTKDVISQIFDR